MFQDGDGIHPHPQSCLRCSMFFSPLPWSVLAVQRKQVLILNETPCFFLNYDFCVCKAWRLEPLTHAVEARECCFLYHLFCFLSPGSENSPKLGHSESGLLWGGDIYFSMGLPPDAAVGEAELFQLWVCVLSWEATQYNFCIPVPEFFTAAILGKGKENLTALSLEKRCQCQPLKNVIKANEKRVEDIFMGLEYCAWKFYGDHRKPERQSHS